MQGGWVVAMSPLSVTLFPTTTPPLFLADLCSDPSSRFQKKKPIDSISKRATPANEETAAGQILWGERQDAS